MAKDSNSGRSIGKKILLIAAYALPLIILAAFGGFYFKKYNDLKNKPVSADQAAQAEIDHTIANVDKLYALPKDEKPSVATVKDKDKLGNQPFFANAENGDVTLIYQNAKLAVLYRPSTNKIINVSSVTIQSGKPKVEIIGKLADRDAAEKILNQNNGNDITVATKADAKSTYGTTVVVDLSGQHADVAQKLAQSLNAKVGTLPPGEDKPAGIDILVIAGAQ